MRWLAFGLLAAAAVCVQTTLVPVLEIAGCRPEFLLILLVHYALHARAPDCLIAGWVLGLLMDLTSVERLGACALVYGIVALCIWGVREVVFSKHPLTQFTLTFLSCSFVQLVLRLFFSVAYDVKLSYASLVFQTLGTALYTGLWAVVIHQILVRLERPLGLRPVRHQFDHRPTAS